MTLLPFTERAIQLSTVALFHLIVPKRLGDDSDRAVSVKKIRSTRNYLAFPVA